MKLRKFILVLLYFGVYSNQVLAEIYKDFLPNDTLASIKVKYPNASFEPIKAAWVKENEAFVALKGVGISGTINLKFSNTDWLWKGFIKYNQDLIEKNPTADNSELENKIKEVNAILNLPLDQRLSLDWLRWIPIQPIPFDRLVSKYGTPEKCDFGSEDFRPYCEWTSKGVNTNLSDDKKLVYSIEYTFTNSETGIATPETAANPKPEGNNKPEIKPSGKTKKKPVSL